jgi:hypothetical protein
MRKADNTLTRHQSFYRVAGTQNVQRFWLSVVVIEPVATGRERQHF